MLNQPAAILPEPPAELKQLSDELVRRMRRAAGDDGLLSFAHYMEMALYEPGLGYYSAGLHKLGAGGDFVTAPELGSVFAQCLARQIGEIGVQLGGLGHAGSGRRQRRLAAALLEALNRPGCPRRYRILERSADLRAQQQQRLAGWPVEWLDAPPGDAWQGVLLANEVLDALAVERFRLGERVSSSCCVDTRGRQAAMGHAAGPGRPGRTLEQRLGERLGAAARLHRGNLHQPARLAGRALPRSCSAGRGAADRLWLSARRVLPP